MIRRIVPGILLAAALLAAAPLLAQDRPGRFDFYVLSLSWSPTYCLSEATAADTLQCGPGRRHGLIVHGLWPQHERGYPEHCRPAERNVPAAVLRGVLDLMPSESLVRHEWRKHGTCSGLSPQGYFALTRRARAKIAVPPELSGVRERLQTTPRAVEAAFRAANPGLPAEGIAVTCDRGRFEEVRICLTKELQFRRCPEVDRRGCRASDIAVPPTSR